jgi:hypothetical protein
MAGLRVTYAHLSTRRFFVNLNYEIPALQYPNSFTPLLVNCSDVENLREALKNCYMSESVNSRFL